MAEYDHDAVEAAYEQSKAGGRGAHAMSTKCPFLDTIHRHLLDFDMQKLCSVTLTPNHVYACLVCGKFYEGRGKRTQAFTHSVEASHHVFINLADGKVYCLPDMYEVIDASLSDIVYALHPTFTPEQIANLDRNTKLSSDILGITYLPGFVGLNNLRHTSYVNVVVQTLAHVTPLRNYFLDASKYAHVKSALVQTFGELLRKLWSAAAFKASISPIEFITEVSARTKKRFSVGKASEAIELMSWLLNALHQDLIAEYPSDAALASGAAATPAAGAKRARGPSAAAAATSIITEVFQGEVEVETLSSELQEAAGPGVSAAESNNHSNAAAAAAHVQAFKPSVQRIPSLFLSLELPPTPLYKDEGGGNVIQQLPLYALLEKFDGETVTDSLRGQIREHKRYRITRLPPYLMMHVKRFNRNNFFVEKNPAIVNFPVKNLEMRPYVAPEARKQLPSQEEVAAMSIADLKALLHRFNKPVAGALEKSELVVAARAAVAAAAGTKYDLCVNVCHDNPPDVQRSSGATDPLATGSYRVHLPHEASGQWYEIQDLHVQETMPQMIGLSETYLMVYRRYRL